MPATFTIPLITVIPGQTITASLWNNEFDNIDTNFIPSGMDDYSTNDSQMQTTEDPFPGGATSRPTSLQGELTRLRFQLANILGETYWYNDPDVDISTFKTRFDAHTHDGTSNQGPQLAAAGLASNAVTTAKILDANVTDAKISAVATTKLTGTISTAQIADSAVTADKIAAAVAGSGLTGGAGTALAVGVDNSTIEINSDAIRVKDGGITSAKLSAAVLALMSPKTIQRTSGAVSFSSESGLKSANVTVTSVDTTKSYVTINGAKLTAGAGSGAYVWSARLTSATNVEVSVSRLGAGTETATYTVYFEVVEWN